MGGCILNLKIWMQISIGFNIISKAHGFSGGNFPQSCGSLLPEHEGESSLFPPETSDPPFAVTFESSRDPGVPITVVLRSEGPTRFRGFMLDAQEISSNAGSSPVGQFVILDSQNSQLLNCSDLKATAVSQKNNQAKSQVKVNWTAEGEERDVIFRATFLETFERFWKPISVRLPPSTTTIKPSSPEPTTKTNVTRSPEPTTKTNVTPTPEVLNHCCDNIKKVAIVLMFLDSIVEEIRMEVFNIQTFLFANKPFKFGLIKMSLLMNSLLVFAADVSSLVLFRVLSFQVAPVALVSALIVTTSVELLAALMPIRPSHELKKIWELVLRGGFAFHQILTIAVIFLGVLRCTDAHRQNGGWPWTLSITIAFTAWIFLTQIWNIVLCIHKRTFLEGNPPDESKHPRRSRTGSLRATKVTLIITSVTLVVGTVAFAIAFVIGLFLT